MEFKRVLSFARLFIAVEISPISKLKNARRSFIDRSLYGLSCGDSVCCKVSLGVGGCEEGVGIAGLCCPLKATLSDIAFRKASIVSFCFAVIFVGLKSYSSNSFFSSSCTF